MPTANAPRKSHKAQDIRYEDIDLKTPAFLAPDVPCSHPGCLSHVSHPCEGCGRIAGRYPTTNALAFATEVISLTRRVRTMTGNAALYDLGYYANAGQIATAYQRISKEMYAQGWNACAGDAVLAEAIRRKLGGAAMTPQEYQSKNA